MSITEQLAGEHGHQRVSIDVEAELHERLEQLHSQMMYDRGLYDLYEAYFRGDQTRPHATATRRLEIDTIAKRSVMNLIPLAVSIPAQLSKVAGYRRGPELFPREYDAWLKSGFASKQTSLFTAALKFGSAYVAVENLGQEDPELKLLTASDTVCFYEDPVNDRFPVWALTIRSRPRDEDTPGLAVYYDAERIVYLNYDPSGDKPFSVHSEIPHSLGRTPVRRFTCELDDAGNSSGVIERLIPAQDRVNQASFDLMSTQSFSAFKVKWTTGVEGRPMLDENGEPVKDDMGNNVMVPIPINPSTFLQTTNSDAKFGTLDETPLTGFLEALKLAVQHFAVQGQLPPHSLLGNLSNLSAETLVAAMAQTGRFADVLKSSWGQGVVDVMELVAIDLGEFAPGEQTPGLEKGHLVDYYPGEVRWEDKSDHTMAAVVDALGKGADMLGIPRRGLWSRFPGATSAEVEEWERMAEEESLLDYDDGDTLEGSARRSEAPAGDGGAEPLEPFDSSLQRSSAGGE